MTGFHKTCLLRSTTAALALAMIAGASAGAASAAPSCDALVGLKMPDARITSAVEAATPVAHCKVTGVIGKETNFAVWLPKDWNGKFVMGGQGGFAGSVENQAMAAGALQKGYATAGTDTGHSAAGSDGSWALGEMERIVNYGHAAIHRVTEVSKFVIANHYEKPADRSYFVGCSNGGRQALQSAQRYPDDFDGIVAGAPALDFVGVASAFIQVTTATYPDAANLDQPAINLADRKAIAAAALAKCDGDDGLKDGIIVDPPSCKFDPAELACKGANADGCLSPAELKVARAVLGGVSVGGKLLQPGYALGSEDKPGGWDLWLVGRKDGISRGVPSLAYSFGVGLMRYFVKQDPNWVPQGYDPANFEKDFGLIDKTLSAKNPDLSAFRSRGGKLLMYHGWSDAALTPNMSTRYISRVYDFDQTARNDVRLFMLPGVLHCAGGPGPDRVDVIDAIDAWVAGGPAPDSLNAGFATGGGGRKVCPYPQKAVFKGQGDGRSPDQFECR
ncbi:tannase/feruloyl esterase family alpha/beta hydrolase [bacterium]|nr:tannase/feruloyl esterase family alpha/beta hydrolase [bacterium]